MRNDIDIETPILQPEEFINNFSIDHYSNDELEIFYQEESFFQLCFKTFAETKNSPEYEKNLDDFFRKDKNGKIKDALKNTKFLLEVVFEALKHDNFKLINKLITSIDDKNSLEILNKAFEIVISKMTNLEMQETLSSTILQKKFDNGENILHIMASQKDLQENDVKKIEEIFAQHKNGDFITHLLDSKNKQGKTPLDIASENNNKVFSDSFQRKPYTILSEIKSSQKLIQEKVNTRSCAVM